MFYLKAKPEVIKRVIDLRLATDPESVPSAVNNFSFTCSSLVNKASAQDPRVIKQLVKIRSIIASPLSPEQKAIQIYRKYDAVMNLFSASQSGLITMDDVGLQALQEALINFEKSWATVNLADAMAFTRDDANIIAVCALLPPMGMLLPDNGEYVSMLISESNASLRSVVSLPKIGTDSLS